MFLWLCNAHVTETEATIWAQSEKKMNILYFLWDRRRVAGWAKMSPGAALSVLDPAWPTLKYPSPPPNLSQRVARMLLKGPTHGDRDVFPYPRPLLPPCYPHKAFSNFRPGSSDWVTVCLSWGLLWEGSAFLTSPLVWSKLKRRKGKPHFGKRKQKAINKDRLVVYFVFFLNKYTLH